jgi:ferredoxin
MTSFRIELIRDGQSQVIEADANRSILESAELAGLELPFSCRAGVCNTCVGRVQLGQIEQDEVANLPPERLDEGFCLLCVAYPRSQLIIETYQEDALLAAEGSFDSQPLLFRLCHDLERVYDQFLAQASAAGSSCATAELLDCLGRSRQACLSQLLDPEHLVAYRQSYPDDALPNF